MDPRTTTRIFADLAGQARAVEALRRGALVAFPTETVYGLGADARSGEAVASIYRAKGRPQFNPLIAHVARFSDAETEGVFGDVARTLASAFWPGPLTLVVPVAASGTVSDLARAGLDSVALRMPSHPVALALLQQTAFPVAAPSANRSGHVSPTTAEHVASDLEGRIDLILDGGPTAVGLESTVVSCLEALPRLLRPGGVPRAALENVLGCRLAVGSGATLVAPGMLASHYAPVSRLRLAAVQARPGEAVLDFAGQLGPASPSTYLDLSPDGDLREAAANLFGFLRRLDSGSAGVIAVAPIPASDLGEAINDRLARAAAPRP